MNVYYWPQKQSFQEEKLYRVYGGIMTLLFILDFFYLATPPHEQDVKQSEFLSTV